MKSIASGWRGTLRRGPATAVQYRCSFCGKSQDSVRRLVAGPGNVYICNECVELCREIIAEEPGPVARALWGVRTRRVTSDPLFLGVGAAGLSAIAVWLARMRRTRS